jgi:hypothetical protein
MGPVYRTGAYKFALGLKGNLRCTASNFPTIGVFTVEVEVKGTQNASGALVTSKIEIKTH